MDKDNMDNLYVKVRTPIVLNRKVRPAYISESFFSRKDTEAENTPGRIMTRNQADKFIPKWNKKVISKSV